jgi:hypothetical protein
MDPEPTWTKAATKSIIFALITVIVAFSFLCHYDLTVYFIGGSSPV